MRRAGYHQDSVTCLGQDDSIYRQGDADTAMGGELVPFARGLVRETEEICHPTYAEITK